jgi:hypothetical protein
MYYSDKAVKHEKTAQIQRHYTTGTINPGKGEVFGMMAAYFV